MGTPVRVIVGLGNPGSKYAWTRHNVGFRVLERVAERRGSAWRRDQGLDAMASVVEIAGQRCLLLKPQTFMNRSGATVLALLERWPEIEPERDLLIVYDDMDLPTGQIRLRPRGGGGGHNGIGDILTELDTKAVPRLRFGVGHPGPSAPVIDWVLSPFSAEEEQGLGADLERAADAVEASIEHGVERAMGQFNRKT